MTRRGVGVCLDEHEHEVRHQAIGDPHLLSVDLVLAVLALLGGGLDRLYVGAELRLGQGKGGADLPRGHAGQVLLLLLLGAELHEQVGADEVGVDDARDRDPAARELLDDHRVSRQVKAHAPYSSGIVTPNRPSSFICSTIGSGNRSSWS